jgi:hypothetical protein
MGDLKGGGDAMPSRRLVLPLALGALLALALTSVALATHARPGSGTPVRVAMVPAFKQCTSPNSSHVLPLPLPSCNPPVLDSDILTMRAVGSAFGFIKLRVLCVPPETTPPCTPGDGQEEEDIAIDTFQADVQCRTTAPGCSGPGADYTGGLLGTSTIRITDHSGGGLACNNDTGAPPCVVVTTIDTDFSVPTNGPTDTSPCYGTMSPAGSICNFSSTINSQVPGVVKERQAGSVSIFGLKLQDPGPDGSLGAGCPPVCGTGDEKTFVDQGIFLP